VTHEDPDAALATSWQAWPVPFSALTDGGVNLARVKTLYIGLGDRANPAVGGEGLVFIDTIGVGTPIAVPTP